MYLFEQDLSGLVKALRANKRDEQKVINTALAEITEEVKSKDWDIKAAAVLKLTYLEMLGHPTLLQHPFPVIECMACPKFHIKQIGYLAASQSFEESTEVILLAHNLIKKDLQASARPSTVILALTSLPTLLAASPQLAEDLLQELSRMLTHSKAQVRRIAALVLGKIWASQHAVALEFSHVEKLRNGLSDEDQSVVSATVNVLLEIAQSRSDALPTLLQFAPELFDLLTNSSNNWMLIKIVKLFAILTPIEPRLVRKLLPPLGSLISTTPAFSLLYECIQTVIVGGMLSSPSPEANSLATTCVEKLSAFLSDADQNLRFIALKGLSRLMVTHAHLLSVHYDEILRCIDEEDFTIRLKALELVETLTNRSNCKDIVQRLLAQIAPSSHGKTGTTPTDPAGRKSAAAALRAIASNYDKSSPSGLAPDAVATASLSSSNLAFSSYRYRLLSLILRITSRSSEDGSQLYANISNFDWYIETLVTCAYLSLSVSVPAHVMRSSDGSSAGSGNSPIGDKIAESLLEITARAQPVREQTVKKMLRLLGDDGFADRGGSSGISKIIAAAAFIVGEYCHDGDGKEVAEVLLSRARQLPRSSETQQAVLLSAMKAISKWLRSLDDSIYTSQLEEGIKKEIQQFVRHFGSIQGASQQYQQLLQLVSDGFDGPRAAALESQMTDGEARLESEPAEGRDQNDPGADPSHNPFASDGGDASSAGKPRESDGELKAITRAPASLDLLHQLFFSADLRPLAPGAQAAVPVPDGLDLDTWISNPAEYDAVLDNFVRENSSLERGIEVDEYGRLKAQLVPSTSTHLAGDDGLVKKKKKSSKKSAKTSSTAGLAPAPGQDEMDDIDSIPIVRLDLDGDASIQDAESSRRFSKKDKQKKVSKRDEEESSSEPSRARTPSPPPLLILSAGGDMPTATRPAASSSRVATPLQTSRPASANALHAAEATEESHAGDESLPVEQAVPVLKVKKKKTKDGSAGAGGKSKKRSKHVEEL